MEAIANVQAFTALGIGIIIGLGASRNSPRCCRAACSCSRV
jgi:hypothetical protein